MPKLLYMTNTMSTFFTGKKHKRNLLRQGLKCRRTHGVEWWLKAGVRGGCEPPGVGGQTQTSSPLWKMRSSPKLSNLVSPQNPLFKQLLCSLLISIIIGITFSVYYCFLHHLQNIWVIKNTNSGVVAHSFNPSAREVEAGKWISVSSRPAWSTEWVPGQLGLLHKQTNPTKMTGTAAHTCHPALRRKRQKNPACKVILRYAKMLKISADFMNLAIGSKEWKESTHILKNYTPKQSQTLSFSISTLSHQSLVSNIT